MNTYSLVPTTQAEELYAALHEQLVLEHLGHGILADAFGPVEDPLDAPDVSRFEYTVEIGP